MKKLTLLLGAVALLGLASCNESIEMPSNSSKNEVVTSLTINIATQAQTKATATEVQAAGSFRGMENMKLFVANANPAAGADFMAGYQYPLGSLAANSISSTQSSKVYTIAFPVGVNNMVFYGLATKPATADPAQYGKITYNVGATKSATNFSIANIATTDFNATATKLATILNDVIRAAGWKTLAQATTFDVSAIPLRDAYKELTTIQSGEVRAGSAAAVLEVLLDLGQVCKGYTATTSIAPADVVAVANAIMAKISSHVTEGAFSDTSIPADFPRNLGLPSGAAQLTFADDNFSYVNKPNAMGGTAGIDISKFAYPVELSYWASSPIRVTDNVVSESDFPKTVANWDAAGSWTNWTANGTVLSSTKGVALQNNINYGTALLKTKVTLKDGALVDNRKAVLDRIYGSANTEGDQEIAQADCKFDLLGILVGGQPSQVGWDWTPVAGATFDNVVYDTYFGSSAVSLPMTEPVYTMVFDNLSSAAAQNVVAVALELKNNTGKDFYGNANVIPAGGVFYLVGQLDLSSISETALNAIDYPANGYRFPPFNTDGTNKKVIRIFMQDFATEANFTINSLKAAYSTVPDLRSTDMKFGLSVDLVWKAGVSFNVPLGE